MAQTKKWRKAKSLFSTTLVTGIGTGTGDTITLNSTSGLPTDTEITLTFGRVDSDGNARASNLVERITGTISGSTLTSYTRGIDGTTEQAHSSSTVVEYIWNADDWNDAIDSFLVEHNDAGTHSDALVTTLKATGAEVTTGTEDAKIVTPKAIANAGKEIIGQVVDGASDLTVGDGKAYFTIPAGLNGYNLSGVHARVITAGTTNTTDIQIANVTDSVDMLSTKLTIDSTETGSDTATTPAVIDTTKDDVATNDLIRIDIDAISTTAPKGLVIRLLFTK